MMPEEKVCLGCSHPLSEPFLDLGKVPLANAFIRPERANQPQPVFPLAVAYCPACHLVQLTDRVPPDQLFSEYLYLSSYSDSFLAHAREMVESLISRFSLDRGSRVLEIGSNDGYLLQYFQRHGISVLGVDPAKNVAREAERRGVPTLSRFFGPAVVADILADFGEADLIIGNNVLAHVPAINEFLEAIRPCLTATGVAVFEFPYVGELLEKAEFDTIYHEHVFYYSLTSIQELSSRAGLELIDVSRQPVHGGSLRIFLQAKGVRPVSQAVWVMLAEEREAGLTGCARYTAFSEDVARLRFRLLSLLHTLRAEGKSLAAYGAPAKGNILLNACGIGVDLLKFTVDRNPGKQGLLTPGAMLPIRPPEELLAQMPDYTLILPWNIAAEIVEQQTEYRRRGGRFIIPIPDPRVV